MGKTRKKDSENISFQWELPFAVGDINKTVFSIGKKIFAIKPGDDGACQNILWYWYVGRILGVSNTVLWTVFPWRRVPIYKLHVAFWERTSEIVHLLQTSCDLSFIKGIHYCSEAKTLFCCELTFDWIDDRKTAEDIRLWLLNVSGSVVAKKLND